jgi:hypothetical protein
MRVVVPNVKRSEMNSLLAQRRHEAAQIRRRKAVPNLQGHALFAGRFAIVIGN